MKPWVPMNSTQWIHSNGTRAKWFNEANEWKGQWNQIKSIHWSEAMKGLIDLTAIERSVTKSIHFLHSPAGMKQWMIEVTECKGVNSIQWNTPIQSYLIEWCDFMNFINNIITVNKYSKDNSYLILLTYCYNIFANHSFNQIEFELKWIDIANHLHSVTSIIHCFIPAGEWRKWIDFVTPCSHCN